MNLNNESKTLFIPLLGKAIMSKKNIFLHDPKSEEIIEKLDYDFSSLKQSKWLSMYMSLRSLIIDKLCNKYLEENKDTTIIHLGCGLDSRNLRIKEKFKMFYDIDYENVIDIRKKIYEENSKYKMISSSVIDNDWLNQIESTKDILIVAEGLTMYLAEEELKKLISDINNKFDNVYFIFDAYTKKGVKASKIKNPVNKLNAEIKYGIDNPNDFLMLNEDLEYVKTHLIKKDNNNLKGLTKFIFNNLYCGKISHSLYKIYEYKLNKE